jgi:hypothetical protein
MTNTSGFYKLDQNRILLFAPNFVECKEYKLKVSNKDSYNLPIDGWYFFESDIIAKSTLGVVEENDN